MYVPSDVYKCCGLSCNNVRIHFTCVCLFLFVRLCACEFAHACVCSRARVCVFACQSHQSVVDLLKTGKLQLTLTSFSIVNEKTRGHHERKKKKQVQPPEWCLLFVKEKEEWENELKEKISMEIYRCIDQIDGWIGRGAHEQQICKVISREILNLS